jgi:hypothetical protein
MDNFIFTRSQTDGQLWTPYNAFFPMKRIPSYLHKCHISSYVFEDAEEILWTPERLCRNVTEETDNRFTRGETAPSTNWIGGWAGSRAGLDVTDKGKVVPLPGIEPRPSSPLLKLVNSSLLQPIQGPNKCGITIKVDSYHPASIVSYT